MASHYSETDLPLVKEDTVVTQVIDHGVEIQRKLIAGTRVPADLIDVYLQATGQKPADDEATDYQSMNVDELQALADERELEITGTGKDGNVVKADLVNALQASA